MTNNNDLMVRHVRFALDNALQDAIKTAAERLSANGFEGYVSVKIEIKQAFGTCSTESGVDVSYSRPLSPNCQVIMNENKT